MRPGFMESCIHMGNMWIPREKTERKEERPFIYPPLYLRFRRHFPRRFY